MDSGRKAEVQRLCDSIKFNDSLRSRFVSEDLTHIQEAVSTMNYCTLCTGCKSSQATYQGEFRGALLLAAYAARPVSGLGRVSGEGCMSLE